MRRLLLTPLVLAAVGCAEVEQPPVSTSMPELAAELAPPPADVAPPAPALPPVDKRVGASMVYAYDPDRVYPVKVAPGRITVLQMARGEEVSVKPLIGDNNPEKWDVTLAQGAIDSVAIRAKAPNQKTNLLITTNAGDYQIDVASVAKGGMDRVRWSYPRPVVATAKPKPQPAFDPASYNRNFEITVPSGGAPKWRPQEVIEAAGKTYIAFPPNLGPMPTAPALFSIGETGMSPVPFRIKGRFFEVDQPLSIAELRLGGEAVRIKRAGGM